MRNSTSQTIPAEARQPSLTFPKVNGMREDVSGQSVEDAESVRIRGRILMMATVVPPVPTAVAFVVKGLLSQLRTDEVVVATERWPSNPLDQIHESNGHRIHFISNKWAWPKRGQRYFQWMKWFLVPRMTRRLIELAKSEKCNAIFAHFPDEQCLCAAFLAARHLSIDFFPFFHNTYRENRRGISYWLATWLQLRAFRAASVVFVMSEGMQQEWQRAYPDHRFEPLLHTFDEAVQPFHDLPTIDRHRVKLGYLGSIGEANLEALRRICGVVNAATHFELNIYSGAPGWFLEREGLAGPRIRHQQPADDVLLDKLRENDLLILPHGLTGGLAPIEYRTIFPTRTIPYLLAGRPILAHSPPNCFLTSWLKRHDCAEVVERADSESLRSAIDGLSNNAERRERLVRNGLQAVEQFQANRVVNNMKRTINGVLR